MSGMAKKRRPEWWTGPRNQLLVLVALVVFLAALVIAIVTVGASPRKDTLGYDARYFAIQFLLLIGLGAIVTFLVDLERRTRETREQRRKFETESVSSMLDELDEIYADVKTIRRILRVDFARRNPDEALLERMLALNHSQEEAERLQKRLEALNSQVHGLSGVAPCAERIDTYLSTLWTKFEETPMWGGWLEPFTSKSSSPGSNFDEFKTPYNSARVQLIDLLGSVSTALR